MNKIDNIRIALVLIVVVFLFGCSNNGNKEQQTIDFGHYEYIGPIDNTKDTSFYRFNSTHFDSLLLSYKYEEAASYLKCYFLKDINKQEIVQRKIQELLLKAEHLNIKHYNQNIQNTFWGCEFGCSREQVISRLKEQGFAVDKEYSTNNHIHFNYPQSRFFSFGEMDWDFLKVSFINDKFVRIIFEKVSKNQIDAINYYEDIVSVISSKYNISDDSIVDNSIIRMSSGFCPSENGIRRVFIGCDRYYPYGSQDIWYRVSLVYSEEKNVKKVSDEL